MRSALLALLAAFSAQAAAQMTPGEALSAGKGVGSSGAPAIGTVITSGTAPATVPHFSATQPQAGLFGGSSALVPEGAGQVAGCQSAPADPDGRRQQQCEATNFLSRKSSPAKFNIPPNDPVLNAARPITGNPESILGSMSGTYSACTQQTVSAPPRKQIEVCAETRAPEERTCEKVLTVTVTQQSSCVPGTWFTSLFIGAYPDAFRQIGIRVFAYCQAEGPVGLYIYNDTTEEEGRTGAATVWVDPATGMVAPQTLTNISAQDLHFGHFFNRVVYHGGSCGPDSCSFLFEIYGWRCSRGGCFRGGTQASGWFTYPRPRISYTVSDQWDNRCAAMEARL
jgi:hypothetical protein